MTALYTNPSLPYILTHFIVRRTRIFISFELVLGAWLFKTQLHPYKDKILLEAQGRGVTNKFIKERF